MKIARYKENDMTRFNAIALYVFEIPIQEKYLRNIRIRVTVLESDPALNKINEATTFYIRVSSIP